MSVSLERFLLAARFQISFTDIKLRPTPLDPSQETNYDMTCLEFAALDMAKEIFASRASKSGFPRRRVRTAKFECVKECRECNAFCVWFGKVHAEVSKGRS